MKHATVALRRYGSPAPGAAVVILALCLCGCVRPSLPLSPAYRQPWVVFYVAHTPTDELAMQEQISAELRRRGLQTASGPFEAMTPETDVLVIYEQRWWQNILVRVEVLHLQLRHARTGARLAAASSRGTSLIGHRPATLVEDAVSELLGSAFD
jgi:hypothetical protein